MSSLIELVGDDVRRLIDQEHPDRCVADDPQPDAVLMGESAVITSVDADRLVELAGAAGCVLHLQAGVGSFVPSGAVLARVEGDCRELDHDEVRGAVRIELERTQREDVAYGFRMLVDVAERSLSDSPFLDPTTSVQAIDRLHDGLRQLAVRELADGTYRDDAGDVRVVVPTMSWEAYVHLAFDEIRLAGVGSPQVTRRLTAALVDLLGLAPEERRPPLQRQLELLREAVHADDTRSTDDRDFALEPDVHGIGIGTIG